MEMNKVSFDEKFTLVANFYPKAGKTAELQEVIDASMASTQGSEGLIQAFCFKPEKPENPFVFVAVWETKKHWQDFMKSPAAQEAHQKDSLRKLYEESLQKATAEMYSVRSEWHQAH